MKQKTHNYPIVSYLDDFVVDLPMNDDLTGLKCSKLKKMSVSRYTLFSKIKQFNDQSYYDNSVKHHRNDSAKLVKLSNIDSGQSTNYLYAYAKHHKKAHRTRIDNLCSNKLIVHAILIKFLEVLMYYIHIEQLKRDDKLNILDEKTILPIHVLHGGIQDPIDLQSKFFQSLIFTHKKRCIKSYMEDPYAFVWEVMFPKPSKRRRTLFTMRQILERNIDYISKMDIKIDHKLSRHINHRVI